jgi:hypothetical protein
MPLCGIQTFPRSAHSNVYNQNIAVLVRYYFQRPNFKKLTAPSATNFQINFQRHCQPVLEAKEKPQQELCALLPVEFIIAKCCPRWRRIFKELSQDGVGKDLSLIKISAPLIDSNFNIDGNFPNFPKILYDVSLKVPHLRLAVSLFFSNDL